jgi:hypothetical protein
MYEKFLVSLAIRENVFLGVLSCPLHLWGAEHKPGGPRQGGDSLRIRYELLRLSATFHTVPGLSRLQLLESVDREGMHH